MTPARYIVSHPDGLPVRLCSACVVLWVDDTTTVEQTATGRCECCRHRDAPAKVDPCGKCGRVLFHADECSEVGA